MMSYVYGNSFAGLPQATTQQDTTFQNDSLYDDLSRQLAAASSVSRRRLSRSSMTARTTGNVMRVAKPTSTSNSPRTSALKQARRRTLMNDSGLFPPRLSPQVATTMAANSTQTIAQSMLSPVAMPQHQASARLRAVNAARPARPVSWHPGSNHLLPTQVPLSVNTQFPAQYASTGDMEPFPAMQPYSLSPAAYSSQTSPSVTFSPYQGTYENMAANNYYYSPNPWAAVSPAVNTSGMMFDRLPSPVDCPALLAENHQQMAVPQMQHNQQYHSSQEMSLDAQQQLQQQIQAFQPAVDPDTEWNSFVAHGFDHRTAPPTPPDNYYSASEPTQTRIPSEGSIAYKPLEEDEPEGEILIGMGLYDPPEKDAVDTTLRSYRATFAHLLGAACYPEPTGKGLKLEDAWEPPENMDDDDDDDDDDRDAEGEEQ